MSDASLIRTILARECDTVNEYETLAAQAESEVIRNLILHLAKEEKEHIAECALVLARLDAEYRTYLAKPLSHVDEGFADDAVIASVQASAAAPLDSPAGAAPHPDSPAGAAGATPSPAPSAVDGGTVTALPSGARISNHPNATTVGGLFRSADNGR